MATEKPLADRVVAALKEHGRLDLDKLAKHAGTTKATLYASTAKWKAAGLIRPVPGERGVYELGSGQAAAPRQAQGGADKTNGSFATALNALRSDRAALAAQMEKLDKAIAVLEALG